jgi:hypothetical protein
MMPLWLSGLILVVLPVVIAMSATVLIRRSIAFEKLRENNEVAGFNFATIGVLYAVLLAFAVVVVWERFNDAEKSVAREAGAAVTIYRLTGGIGGQPGGDLHEALSNYLKAAVEDDWPAMEKGGPSPAATRALDATYVTLLAYDPSDRRGVALLTEVLFELDQLTQARRGRLVLASGVVPGIIWFVLFGGAVLTVAFTFFFGAKNLLAQTAMTGALTALIFSGLLVIVTIDHPFAGTVKVGSEPLSRVLEEAVAGLR